jgi:hypothetical protein
MLRHVQDELQIWWKDLIVVYFEVLPRVITNEIKVAGFVSKREVAMLHRKLQS